MSERTIFAKQETIPKDTEEKIQNILKGFEKNPKFLIQLLTTYEDSEKMRNILFQIREYVLKKPKKYKPLLYILDHYFNNFIDEKIFGSFISANNIRLKHKNIINICGKGEEIFKKAIGVKKVILINEIALAKYHHPSEKVKTPKISIIFDNNYLTNNNKRIYKDVFYTPHHTTLISIREAIENNLSKITLPEMEIKFSRPMYPEWYSEIFFHLYYNFSNTS